MDVMERSIQINSGSSWLRNLKPLYLFTYLKGLHVDSEIIDYYVGIDDDSGWFFILDISESEDKIRVKGYFYQKGSLPVLYQAWLKRVPDWCWYSVDEIDDHQHFDWEYCSRLGDFRNILLNTKGRMVATSV